MSTDIIERRSPLADQHKPSHRPTAIFIDVGKDKWGAILYAPRNDVASRFARIGGGTMRLSQLQEIKGLGFNVEDVEKNILC